MHCQQGVIKNSEGAPFANLRCWFQSLIKHGFYTLQYYEYLPYMIFQEWKACYYQHMICQDDVQLPTYYMPGSLPLANLITLPTCDIQWRFAFANIYLIYLGGFLLPTYDMPGRLAIGNIWYARKQGFGSGSGSAWIRVNLSCWIRIRIQEGKNDQKRKKKVQNFHVLKCWMFSFEGWWLHL